MGKKLTYAPAQLLNGAEVAEIRREMDKAKTSKKARQQLAKWALQRNNVTECGRAEWQKEFI